MLWGIPSEVKSFFRPVVRNQSKPIRKALAPMVLALLLAPHYRRMKTIAGMVLGDRVHVATITRRLHNPLWKTRDWYVGLADRTMRDLNSYERSHLKGRRRRLAIIIDTTLPPRVRCPPPPRRRVPFCACLSCRRATRTWIWPWRCGHRPGRRTPPGRHRPDRP